MDQFRLLTRTRQSTEYSCGASALQAVLSYWGKDVDEAELMELMHTNPEVGTNPEDIIRGARSLGFNAELKEHLSLDEVERRTANGDPMIALGQVWRSHKDGASSVADEWDNGHYIVVLGVDKDYVYFQDPYVRMSKAFVPRKSFEEHWHQAMGGDRVNNPELMHLGIFVRGREPAKKRAGARPKLTKSHFKNRGSLNLIITQFRGVLLPYDFLSELMSVWASGDVRPDAFVFLRKDKNGSLSAMQGSRLEEEGDMAAINALITAIAKKRVKSARSARSGIERALSAVSEGDFGLPASQIRRIAQKLPSDHSAVIVLVENVWERKFKETAKKYRGAVIEQKLIAPEELAAEVGKLLSAPH
jgi:predicted double-glycine peptidase